MDVIALLKNGYSAAASLGTAFTKEQAELVAKTGRSVLLCYDSDCAGVMSVKRSIPILKEAGIKDIRVIDLSPCKDPDELLTSHGKDVFEKKITEAEDGIIFLIKNAAKTCSDRKEFSSRYEEIISLAGNEKAVYEQFVSDEYGFDEKQRRLYKLRSKYLR